MKNTIRLMLMVLVLIGAGTTAGWSQSGDYNPANPADPLMKTKVTCTTSPENAGYTSGSGSYTTGTTVTVNASAASEAYDFKYWTLNGEKYTESQTFTYTTTRDKADFVAVFDYNPKNPGDPQTDHNYHLNLAASPASACSFNQTSGARHLSGSSVNVTASPNQYYEFQGWFDGDTKKSDDLSYTFTMPEQSLTLTAKFVYNYSPASPDEPAYNLLGDVNRDGRVDVSDASTIVSKSVGKTPSAYVERLADYNGDGKIDVSDASAIVNHAVGKSQ